MALPIPPQQGDEQALFELYSDRLRRFTALGVVTSPEIVDDACAFAWMKLISNQPGRETVFGWLKAVARNEAIRLDRLSRGLVALDEDAGERPAAQPVARRGRVDVAQSLIEVRERLEALPRRERQMVILNVAGWRHDEIAERLSTSDAGVNRSLAAASARMRAMDVREHQSTSPRNARLRELEHDPPHYTTTAIGPPPPVASRKVREELRREWRRVALGIEDFRDRHGITDRRAALGSDPELPGRDEVATRISGFRRSRGLRSRPGLTD
jgi:DNA-directed RNA polymerase specialized sigma24 family protein